MGRRSFISMTTINRIISSSNRIRAENKRIDMINSQKDIEKELPPEYSLVTVSFNNVTRVAKIEFLQTQKYRTIERYVTQDYVKHPIYSEWKTKTKSINKTIKLTNIELESLNLNSDYLIKDFSSEIIMLIGNEDLFPSWFIKKYLGIEYEETISNIKKEYDLYINEKKKDISRLEQDITDNTNKIDNYKCDINNLTSKENKLCDKIIFFNKRNKSIILAILTAGVHAYLTSRYRLNKLNKKKDIVTKKIDDIKNDIGLLNVSNDSCSVKVNKLKQDINEKDKEKQNKLIYEHSIYIQKIDAIEPLPSNYEIDDNKFTALKIFNGVKADKIIGVYIIRNIEKDKYYVGQSKDVFKRLKQHFKGTVPNNVIFAEDYYTSKLENRADLFEVKIIRCNTKDELDRLEKENILKYDAMNSGYNSTSGNS